MNNEDIKKYVDRMIKDIEETDMVFGWKESKAKLRSRWYDMIEELLEKQEDSLDTYYRCPC